MELSGLIESAVSWLKRIKEMFLLFGLVLVSVGCLCFLGQHLLLFWTVLEIASYNFARFSAGIGFAFLALYFASNVIVAYVDSDKREYYRQTDRWSRRLDK